LQIAARPLAASVFDAAVLDVRLRTADSVLFSVLDHQLAQRLRDTNAASEFSDRVRKTISDYVHREELAIDQVAKLLNISERTLQRRLTDAGTTFRDLVDEVRKSRALALLQTGAPAREISFLLGYAEEAGFYRAFHRWTGVTLERWKSRIAAG
jgi:AraC-like DNA-binding protein